VDHFLTALSILYSFSYRHYQKKTTKTRSSLEKSALRRASKSVRRGVSRRDILL
jgi:hypothetical protein